MLGESLANGLLNKALRGHVERLREDRLKTTLKGRQSRSKCLQKIVAEITRIMGDTLFAHVVDEGRSIKHTKHYFLGLYPDDRPLATIRTAVICVTGKNPLDYDVHGLDIWLSRHACIRLIQGTHTHADTAMAEAMQELNAQVFGFFDGKKKLAHLKYESFEDTVIETYTQQGVGIWQMGETAILKTFIPLSSLDGKKRQRLRTLGQEHETHSFLCRGDEMILQVT